MAIDLPKSDLSRSIQHDRQFNWPKSVKIQLLWEDEFHRRLVRTEMISSAQFFGHGNFGAPLEGTALIMMIERMRRAGPPEVKRRGRK